MSQNNLYLLDAYALIYRAYFAFIRNPRINSKGQNTSAIYGFMLSLKEVLSRPDAKYVAVAFDPAGPTFRHEMYPEYKATRESTPEPIKLAIPYIKELIKAHGVKIYEKEGYEADDVIGTIAKKISELTGEQEPHTTFMVTPDKDYAQLVRDDILLMRPAQGGGFNTWTPETVTKRYGFQEPENMIDYLALMGDSSDNVPGCKGVGEKTAAKLLSEYKNVEEIYAHLDELKGRVKTNLEKGKEDVRLSRTLVTIHTDVPIEFNMEDCLVKEMDVEKVVEIYTELEFRSFLAQMDLPTPTVTPMGTNKAPGLFDNLATPEKSEKKPEESVVTMPSLFDSMTTEEPNYVTITTVEEGKKLAEKLRKAGKFAFDTETEGLDPQETPIVGASFSCQEGEGYYLPLPPDKEKATELLVPFRELFLDEKVLKVAQNLKFDLAVLRRYGIESKGDHFDTMIAHYLINPELSHGMDYMAETYLGYKTVPITELIGPKGRKQKSMRDIEVEKVAKYAAEDADITFRLYLKLKEELEKSEALKRLFYDLEMPLTLVLAQMEATGVAIDIERLEEAKVDIEGRLEKLSQKIYETTGHQFNINSPKEVGDILFGELKLLEKPKKTKTGNYETREETLQKVKSKHPSVELILRYRGLRKLLSTYVEALPKLVNPNTGRVHTTFNQTVTATGRLSSTNPNLQNIPIRDDDGKEIRRAFVPNRRGDIYLSADYSQIELRLMAHLSQDPAMLEAFENNMDIHTATASRVFKVDTSEVDGQMRRKAKTANFGIIYGITPYGLSERLSISPGEAKDIIDGYFASFPKVKEYMDRSIEQAREQGYVETIMGRRRYLKDIKSANSVVRGFAERTAINAPIQGSAADIIKLAMVRIARRFKEEKLESQMLLQVHDELNFSVRPDEQDKVFEIVKEEMEKVCPEVSVPLTVDIGTGENWLEAH